VPYSPSDAKSPEIPIVLYDGDDAETDASVVSGDEPEHAEKSASSHITEVQDSEGESSLDDVS
jgi:hypothetical protein